MRSLFREEKSYKLNLFPFAVREIYAVFPVRFPKAHENFFRQSGRNILTYEIGAEGKFTVSPVHYFEKLYLLCPPHLAAQ